jgi:hypothetical protein
MLVLEFDGNGRIIPPGANARAGVCNQLLARFGYKGSVVVFNARSLVVLADERRKRTEFSYFTE